MKCHWLLFKLMVVSAAVFQSPPEVSPEVVESKSGRIDLTL